MTDSSPLESSVDSEDKIPKLPRAHRFGKPSLNGIVRIGMIATVLYAIIVMRRPCADGVSQFIFKPGATLPDTDTAVPTDPAEQYPGFQLITAEEFMKRYHDGGVLDGDAAAERSDSGSAPAAK